MTAAVPLLIVAGQPMPYPEGEWIWSIDDDTTDTPVDLTGWTARAYIRSDLLADGDPVLQMTTENGKIVLGGVTGSIKLVLTAAETTALWRNDLPVTQPGYEGRQCFSLGFWDIELIAPGGVPERLMQGPVRICPEATR